MNGQREKAIATYEKGLKTFPKSGRLHLERGNMEGFIGDYEKALSFFEKGIAAAPTFPSDYFWAAKIYCNSTEEVWGMIYGEIFMNLERNSRRTAEISKLLFDTYLSEIKFTSDTSLSVSFSKNAAIQLSLNDLKDPAKLKLPFGVGIYEPTLMMSILPAKSINLASLSEIRSAFVDNYFGKEHHKSYPNALFSYQKQIKDAGYMEAYNYWVLMKGDENGFKQWKLENEEKWESFLEWFSKNSIQLSETNKFFRLQY